MFRASANLSELPIGSHANAFDGGTISLESGCCTKSARTNGRSIKGRRETHELSQSQVVVIEILPLASSARHSEIRQIACEMLSRNERGYSQPDKPL